MWISPSERDDGSPVEDLTRREIKWSSLPEGLKVAEKPLCAEAGWVAHPKEDLLKDLHAVWDTGTHRTAGCSGPSPSSLTARGILVTERVPDREVLEHCAPGGPTHCGGRNRI